MTVKYISVSLLALVVISFFAACKKDVPPASYQDGVWFYEANSNLESFAGISDQVKAVFTREYSFYFNDAPQDTLWLPEVRVMGVASDRDREINLTVDSSTAVAGVNYRLLKAVMPAHALKTRIGVLLLRSPDLDNKKVELNLRLSPSAAFPAAIAADTLSRDKSFFSGSTYKVILTNQPSEPPYWSSVQIYFGSWSRVKYEFIYSVIGVKIGLTANNTDELNYLFPWFLRVKRALEEYNIAHPNDPLTDENGYTIYF